MGDIILDVPTRPEFHNEEAAYAHVEARIWADGRVCPHCGVVGKSSKMGGKSTRVGAYKCYACRKPFTVKIGTIFEASHVPMNLWLQAIYLMCASKAQTFTYSLFCHHRFVERDLEQISTRASLLRALRAIPDSPPNVSRRWMASVSKRFIGSETKTLGNGFQPRRKASLKRFTLGGHLGG